MPSVKVNNLSSTVKIIIRQIILSKIDTHRTGRELWVTLLMICRIAPVSDSSSSFR
ncbi:hypothetical protein BH18THE2_BH18THE2_42080 [soil metagenome]